MRPVITFSALAFALAACNSVLETTGGNDRTGPLLELAARRAQWNEQEIQSYDFHYVCTCPSPCTEFSQQPVTIEVRDAVIASVVDEDGNALAPVTGVSWPTIDSLYVWAQLVLSDQSLGVQVLFDPTDHYVTRLRHFPFGSESALTDHVVSEFVAVTR